MNLCILRLGTISNNNLPVKRSTFMFAKASAQIKIMMVLCGTKEDFFISTKWMTKRTGLSQQSYSEALKKLVKRGWVSHRNYQTIRVNFDKIYEDGRQLDDVMEWRPHHIRFSRTMSNEILHTTSEEKIVNLMLWIIGQGSVPWWWITFTLD